MTCTAINHVHRRAVKFELKLPEDENSADFAYRATGNAHLLPDYMRVSLFFLRSGAFALVVFAGFVSAYFCCCIFSCLRCISRD